MEIHSQLIPLKYKVKATERYFEKFKALAQNLKSPNKYNSQISALVSKIDKKILTEKDKGVIFSIVNLSNFYTLRNNAQKELGQNYDEETILCRKWVNLRDSLENPVCTLQGIYFEYAITKHIVNIFGAKLAPSIEEIVRDSAITKAEREYIIEKAGELGIDLETIKKKLDQYISHNPAICKIVYEICEDGLITEAERQYLLEKSAQYGSDNIYLLSLIEDTVSTIKKVITLFEDPDFYENVLEFFLVKFLMSSEEEAWSDFLEKIHEYIVEETVDFEINNTFCLNDICFVLRKNFNYPSKKQDVGNLHSIFRMLGLEPQPHQSLCKNIRNKNNKIINEQEIGELFNNKSNDYLNVNSLSGPVKINGELYTFKTIKDRNHPLFSFDVIADNTIISVNEDHFFYKDTEYFKLYIITIVSNLKKNYASVDLVDEVQHLLNPPAFIRINHSLKKV